MPRIRLALDVARSRRTGLASRGHAFSHEAQAIRYCRYRRRKRSDAVGILRMAQAVGRETVRRSSMRLIVCGMLVVDIIRIGADGGKR